MMLAFYHGDTPQGHAVDWPVVPRPGEYVQYPHPGGGSTLMVDKVIYRAAPNGDHQGITVHLAYSE